MGVAAMRIVPGRRMLTGLLLASAWASPALAQSEGGLAGEVAALRAELERQRRTIEAQQQQIGALQERLDAEAALAGLRGRGLVQAETSGTVAPPDGPAVATPLPDRPVGEAPPEPPAERRALVSAVPEDQGVLTPAGMFVLDPQIEYVNASANRLVFRGIELIPGIQIGLIEASDVDRNTLVGTLAGRYGITRRLEAEVRVPFLHRDDRIEVVQQRDEGIVRTIELEESGIGDVEFGLRYQINRARPLKPIWIGQLRVKSDTGKGPFDIGFDEFGVATGLATGSGFWGVQPGISFLLPSDPVVIYGGASYLWHIPRDVDRLVGDALIGRVDPGDAIAANVGFGFALNPRFSFSLGYRHNYIFASRTEIGDTVQRSNTLQVGSLTMGFSYRVTERQTLNLGFNFGVTEAAPDLSVSLRLPIAFGGPRR
ncbi:MAG: transporter [Allosphingosinicella sp.]